MSESIIDMAKRIIAYSDANPLGCIPADCDMPGVTLTLARQIVALSARTPPEESDIMRRLYERLAPLAFMPTAVPQEEAKRLGYPHVKLNDVETAIREELFK